MTTAAAADRFLECRVATSPRDRQLHHQIRQQVFVAEQAIFTDSDRDDWDEYQQTQHVVAWADGVGVGTVRLYPLPPGTSPNGVWPNGMGPNGMGPNGIWPNGIWPNGIWQGDRLAVLPQARDATVGADLVRFAVATAAAAGGEFMVAHIQLPNVRFFSHLGWHKHAAVEIYAGRPHQPMCIELQRSRQCDFPTDSQPIE